MANFQYKALQSATGKIVIGALEAPNRGEAFKNMEALGLKPIQLQDAGAASGSGTGSGFSFGSKKVSFRELENFTRLLSSLLAAGVPLSRALVILTREASNPTSKEQWQKIHDRVVDGMALADAMGQSPDTFPKVYVAMVEAGEAGGFLDLVLAQIADFQARDKELRGKVSAALIYPLVLLFLAVSVLIFLMVFFIPRFKTLFEGFGADLPWLTRVIVGVSEFSQSYGWLVALAVGATVYLGRSWLVSDAGKRKYENALLKMPVVGPLTAKFAMARFCRMLGSLLHAGVPLISGLNVARRSMGNQILVDAIASSVERVKKGDSLARSLGECRALFAGSTLEMITVAEESGRLDEELMRIAGVTESDLDQNLRSSVALMEPLMLFFIAGFIGIIFIGMVIPIFTIQDYIK